MAFDLATYVQTQADESDVPLHVEDVAILALAAALMASVQRKSKPKT